jgi:hypothetical protein
MHIGHIGGANLSADIFPVVLIFKILLAQILVEVLRLL